MARRIDLLGAATLASAAWAISLVVVVIALVVDLALVALTWGDD
jgi:hypothetical protein